MHECGCGCGARKKVVRYVCQCGDECECDVKEYTEEPGELPYCCGVPMKREE